MRSVRRNARVKYSAMQMFDLVDDIESYPQFLPWCQRADVRRRTEAAVEATLDVGLGGVHKQFSTRNRLVRPKLIEIKLVEGPFRSLDGAWRFEDKEEGGSEVSLKLDFDLSMSPLNMIFAALFEEVVRSQVTAFTSRADALYG